jgi:hypothetical protein
MRLPNTGDLAARVRTPEEESVKQDRVGHHIETLASKLNEAYEVVMKSNKISREKQKVQYDKNTKLRTFAEGDYVYLKEITVGKNKKFRIRWQGPFRITKRYSDLNYQIQLKPGKLVTVNINRLKKCNNPPRERKARKETVSIPMKKQVDDEWNESDDEPLKLLARPKLVISSEDRHESNCENTEPTEAAALDDEIQDNVETVRAPIQEGLGEENQPGRVTNAPRYYLRSQSNLYSEAASTAETSDVSNGPEGQADPINEGGNIGQGQLYPYFLKPLPGRQHYSPTDHTND